MKQKTLFRPEPIVKKTFRGYAEIVCGCGYGITLRFPLNDHSVVPTTTYTMHQDCPDCGMGLSVHWQGRELM